MQLSVIWHNCSHVFILILLSSLYYRLILFVNLSSLKIYLEYFSSKLHRILIISVVLCMSNVSYLCNLRVNIANFFFLLWKEILITNFFSLLFFLSFHCRSYVKLSLITSLFLTNNTLKYKFCGSLSSMCIPCDPLSWKIPFIQRGVKILWKTKQ